ncbi:PucR family transcriptional regulator [Amycolatopsis anabasis]|uniref:PucR family transcriptional regulator n=1 Tax=Amycolatopsis anabasis TaxID=1840409 RepID=UPI00131E69EC|nr:PucR family transcriptional regulator [Amycolatopsis anabasis]
MSLTVEALAEQPGLGLRLLTGEPGTRIVSVFASELPDPAPYLVPGALLLTTGAEFDPASPDWAEYAEKIAAVGGTALGFGLSCQHETVPWPLRRAAARVRLPVLEIGEDVPFIALSKAVATAAYAVERRARGALLRLILAGQSDLAEKFAAELGIELPRGPVRFAVLGVADRDADALLGTADFPGLLARGPAGELHAIVPGDDRGVAGVASLVAAAPGATGLIGEPVDPAQLPAAARNVGVTFRTSTLPAGRLTATTELATAGLLAQVSHSGGRAWATALLDPLAHPNGTSQVDLLGTVRAFLARNGNTEAASADLGIHRRTLRYRLGRAEAALGKSLDDPNDRAELWIALRLAGLSE